MLGKDKSWLSIRLPLTPAHWGGIHYKLAKTEVWAPYLVFARLGEGEATFLSAAFAEEQKLLCKIMFSVSLAYLFLIL